MVRAIAVVILLAVTTTSQPTPASHPSETPPEQQQPRQYSSDAGSLPSGVNQLAPDVGGGEKQKLDKKGHLKPPPVQPSKTPFDWITIFTGVLAVLAGLQWWAMLRQAKYMRDGLEETKKATNAATSAAGTARRALEAVERPDVLVASVTPDPDTVIEVSQYPAPMIGIETVLNVVVQNYGRTTARELRIAASVGVVAPETPHPTVPFMTIELPYVLGAGAPYEFSFRPLGRFLSQQIIGQIIEGITQLYVEVEISYDDDFNNQRYSITGTAVYREQTGKFFIMHTAATGQPSQRVHVRFVRGVRRRQVSYGWIVLPRSPRTVR